MYPLRLVSFHSYHLGSGVAAVFTVILRFYTRTSQQLRRLDLGSKTPLYSLLTDTYVIVRMFRFDGQLIDCSAISVDADGLRTIRAFGYESHFTAINTERVRSSQKPYCRFTSQSCIYTSLLRSPLTFYNARSNERKSSLA